MVGYCWLCDGRNVLYKIVLLVDFNVIVSIELLGYPQLYLIENKLFRFKRRLFCSALCVLYKLNYSLTFSLRVKV